ncbi:unnamed protein product [Pleuronectes platessa]|uniref:Uncharacterized protein n=1 Tax=Pleuronectes platessa TaxID=8262 RepID=A0A9N7Z1K7_PLEPL|nr:unnamed protein product [Pleuronectes platessa]
MAENLPCKMSLRIETCLCCQEDIWHFKTCQRASLALVPSTVTELLVVKASARVTLNQNDRPIDSPRTNRWLLKPPALADAAVVRFLSLFTGSSNDCFLKALIYLGCVLDCHSHSRVWNQPHFAREKEKHRSVEEAGGIELE